MRKKRDRKIAFCTAILLIVSSFMACGEMAASGGETDTASAFQSASSEDVAATSEEEKDQEKAEEGAEDASGREDQAESETASEENQAGESGEDGIVSKNPEMKDITAQQIVSEMKIGWNLGNTLDSTNGNLMKSMPAVNWETAWGNPETTKELIDTVTSSSFQVIRIPVSWNDHIMVAENYKIQESWMDRVQEIVDYAYENGAYVILNTHHEDWYATYYDKEEQSEKVLNAVWTQIAERFRDYDEHLIFEGLNEPRKKGTSVEWNGGDQEGWDVVNDLNRVFVETVRKSGGNNEDRILMIPGYAANCFEGMKHVEIPEQRGKIIVSVHAYEPYDFALNKQGRGTWDNDTVNIDCIMQSIDELFLSKGIPVIIGEFGAMYKDVQGNEEERAAWAKYYVNTAAKKGIPCIWWDNGAFEGDGELFGLIDRESCEWKYPLIVEALKEGTEAADIGG